MDALPHEVQVYEYVKTIERLKKQNQDNPLFTTEIHKLEGKLEQLKKEVYTNLTPWERVQISRHPSRPHTVDFIKHMTDSFVELKGDRLFGEDEAIIGGLGMIGGEKVLIIGQEKGCDTESRVKRNFGMLQPEGYRKALRLMKLAEKFKIPVISLLDTPGAFPGLEAEERGQGRAIAHNLMEMAQIKTPIIVIVIGEGCSGGALGMGIGDVVGMLEHSYYSVISPEGCASILFKDAQKNKDAAAMLKLNAEDLLSFGIIDHIIEEPLGGAHHNPELTCQNVKEFFLDQLVSFKRIPPDLLLEQRYSKYRKMGKYETTTENDFKD